LHFSVFVGFWGIPRLPAFLVSVVSLSLGPGFAVNRLESENQVIIKQLFYNPAIPHFLEKPQKQDKRKTRSLIALHNNRVS
jgi:hypothetical protein